MKVSPKRRWKQGKRTSRCGRCSWFHRWKEHCIWTRVIKKSEFENIESLSNITRKGETSEITNVSSLEVASSSWERTALLNDQAMKCATAQVYVYPDSVSCLGGLNSPDDAIRRWEEQVSSLKMKSSFRQVQGLAGEPIDFEWKIFTGCSASQLLHTIQKDLEGKHIIPENVSRSIHLHVHVHWHLTWKERK